MNVEQAIRCSVVIMLLALLGVTPLRKVEAAVEKTSGEEVAQEAGELLQALKTYTVEQRDEALRKTGEALDNLDRRIDALETRIDNDWEKMDQAAREKARASLRELRRQRTRVAEWSGRMQSGSVDAWEQIKKGFSDAYWTLHDAWVKSNKEIGPDK